MRTVGIVAEYNPFHTGHEYHLQKAKELSGADYSVVVMSPDYVQRGVPAVFDKYIRTEMALRCGADLVIELPLCYATGSAEYFAEGAVRLLDALGVIDTLCFGAEMIGTPGTSETGVSADARLFQTTAQVLLEEPESYKHVLREGLRQGLTFPRARADALKQYNGISDLLSTPNNILGVEYCKALKRIHSGMRPLPLPRRGSSYADFTLRGEFCSAGAIRECLRNNSPHLADRYIPERIRFLFSEAGICPIFPDDLLSILSQKLIYYENLEEVFDLSPDLARRIRHLRFQCLGKSFQECASLLKTKQVTEARIRRVLLHLILDIRQAAVDAFCREGYVYYAHVLGFRRDAAPLMHEIKCNSTLPLITKAAKAGEQLSDTGRQMWSLDRAASHLYRAIRAERYGIPFQTEQEISPVRV